MGKVISVFNHKGGLGKTTLVHNVGTALAHIGKRVLFVDADPQMNLTAAFYGLSDNIEFTIGSNKEAGETISDWEREVSQGTSLETILYQSM